MDPQQRLLLEAAGELLLSSNNGLLAAARATMGTFVGLSSIDYAKARTGETYAARADSLHRICCEPCIISPYIHRWWAAMCQASLPTPPLAAHSALPLAVFPTPLACVAQP